MKTTFRLVLAEKPSAAQSIAAVLGCTDRKDGFFIGGGYIVSWCFGHLVELAAPEGKKKQLDTLRSLMNRADVIDLICATDAGDDCRARGGDCRVRVRAVLHAGD
jgi:DNA topoisomerase-3